MPINRIICSIPNTRINLINLINCWGYVVPLGLWCRWGYGAVGVMTLYYPCHLYSSDSVYYPYDLDLSFYPTLLIRL